MHSLSESAAAIALLTMSMGLGDAAAQDAAGDPEVGREIAQSSCARCHDVEPGGPFKLYPPSFASIAAYRSDEQIRARIIFPPLHSGMPEIGWMLSPFEVTDMVSYIRSIEPELAVAE